MLQPPCVNAQLSARQFFAPIDRTATPLSTQGLEGIPMVRTNDGQRGDDRSSAP
jgi:hypothetical protein